MAALASGKVPNRRKTGADVQAQELAPGPYPVGGASRTLFSCGGMVAAERDDSCWARVGKEQPFYNGFGKIDCRALRGLGNLMTVPVCGRLSRCNIVKECALSGRRDVRQEAAVQAAPEELIAAMEQEVQQCLESAVRSVNDAADGSWIAGRPSKPVFVKC